MRYVATEVLVKMRSTNLFLASGGFVLGVVQRSNLRLRLPLEFLIVDLQPQHLSFKTFKAIVKMSLKLAKVPCNSYKTWGLVTQFHSNDFGNLKELAEIQDQRQKFKSLRSVQLDFSNK